MAKQVVINGLQKLKQDTFNKLERLLYFLKAGQFITTPKPNKKDFMWHVVPNMKSSVALHPGT